MDSIWYEILVVALGVLLAVFLILAITVSILIIKIARVAKRITERAEQVADHAEHISAFFEKTATPVALFKLVTNFSEVFQKKGKKK